MLDRMRFPKRSWSEVPLSPTGHADMPESALQTFADQYLELRRLKYIRIPDEFFRWIKMHAPARVQKWFFHVFGGFPDDLILISMGKYMLAVPMELKTQDEKGRAVGRLHGRQKRNARDENWIVARSTNQIQDAIAAAEEEAKKIMVYLSDGRGG